MVRKSNAVEPDNMDPASMAARANEPQIRIGQEVPEPEPVAPELETPPGLRLTDKEQARVERLVDQGYDRGTAISYAVSSQKRDRIVGHHIAKEEIRKIEKSAEERKKQETPEPIPMDELIVLLRGTDPTPKSKDSGNNGA